MIQARTKRTAGNKAWALGLLLAALVATMMFIAGPAHAVTFEVNSTGDDGDQSPNNGFCNTEDVISGTNPECTLRAAIEETNANNNDATFVDEIHFDLGVSGVKTISPASSLPEITEPVVIDGYTQPGAKKNTLAVGDNADIRVRLDGSSAGVAAGLRILADDSVVRGLSITRFFTALVVLGTDDNEIEGNFIGTDPGGTQALGSSNSLRISGNGASGNTVGGTTPQARNVISGNDFGVVVSGAGTAGNKVQGNYIGTTKSGTGDLGNRDWGVIISDGASNNLVGGESRAAANIIAFNGTSSNADGVDGVAISDAASTGNSVLGNSIFSNSDLGIDLGGNGPTPNDPGDADTGANNLQNFPVISSARTSGAKTTIGGNLHSAPNRFFVLEFFSGPQANPSGFGEGKTFIGKTGVTTDASGNVSFAFVPGRAVSAGHRVTATATNGGGDTSEFSAAVAVDGPPTITPLSPKSGSKSFKRNVSIRAVVRDDVSDLAKGDIRLFVDGKRKANFAYNQAANRLSFTARNLSFKRHTVRIIATDGAGNVASKQWSFTVKKKKRR